MSKLTRKYGKKFVNFKAFAVATMAGIASLGATNSVMAQDAGVIEPLSYGSGAIVEKFNFAFDEENYEKYLEYTTDDSADVTIKYDDSSSKVYDFEYKDYSSDAGTITSGSNSSKSPTELGSAGAVNPPSVSNVIFENNFSSGTVKYQSGGTLYGALSGGALYNDDSIESIAADFIGNEISIIADSTVTSGYSMYSSAEGRGGAIANYGEIQNLSGTFAYNSVNSKSNSSTAIGYSYGGAIYNAGLINSISGNFLFNTVDMGFRGWGYGGAIYNTENGIINSINADFIGNYSSGEGSAICNYGGQIGTITGDFVANSGAGAVIYNSNDWGSDIKPYIKDVNGNFYENSGNYVIYNSGVIESITGNFINNTGTAIENRGLIYKGISGNFIGNATAISDDGGEYVGTVKGYFANHVNNAIFGNLTKVMHIQDSVFENNTHRYEGGAVNLVSMGQPGSLEPEDASTFPDDVDLGVSITNSVFNNNYIDSENSGMGGAIYNDANNLTISNVEFNNNYVRTTGEEPYYYNDGSYGGAIYNDYNGAIANIQANFSGNYVESLSSSAKGGAIYNDGQVAKTVFYARYNITDSNGNVTDVIYKFDDGYTEEDINKNKDAVYVEDWSTTYTLSDYLDSWSRYKNCNTLEDTLVVDANYGEYSTMMDVPSLSNPYASGIVNSNFVNNYAVSEMGIAQGGAIYTSKDLNIITKDGYNSLISGNYVEDSEGKRPEAIHVANNILEGEYVAYAHVNNGTRGYSIYEDKAESTTLRLINTTNGKIKIDDQIVGQVDEMINGKYYWIYGNDGSSRQQYVNDLYYDIDTPTDITIVKSKLEILGDDTGLVQLNNDVKNMDILLANSNIHLGNRDNVLDNNNFFALAGSLSMINNQAGLSDLATFGLIDKLDFYADVDLENETMDSISAGEYYVDEDAVFNVAGMNMLSDMKPGVDRLDIMFAEDGLKDNVIYQAGELPHANVQTEVYTPIYKYNVSYDNREDAGYFIFLRGDKILTEGGGSSSTGNSSDALTQQY
ncbi:hypothetical protein J6A64_07400 [bacterium]|nr:hypothetical protein [bacterium]